MSGASYGERGGVTALRATSALQSTHDLAAQPTFPRNSNKLQQRNASSRNTQITNNTRPQMKPTTRVQDGGVFGSGCDQDASEHQSSLDFPATETTARSELLKDAVFPSWKDDAGSDALESPEEMQKKDPLGTQIWKLYSRTKTRLPNQERMENLTWRMMAMNLKRLEKEQAMYGLYSSLQTSILTSFPELLRKSRW